ncbi:MAG: hypothetical protein Unbinned4585contig1001_11 [Prokaryotic dsDNA virus sp.]|nr:MAG: hypothetical protein Unbinned4585contig1001_11 [Prokaryotic dsDNA virus sp.]|tara:strand:+ start:3289 stop:3549 length:261 start_codon:yes stop_codon:yes gene_type:complete
MRFKCDICGNEMNLYKVKFTAGSSGLVCKDAMCCNEYMKQVITDEYEGMPEIKRNEPIHSIPNGDDLWLAAKKKLASGEPPKNKNK